MKVYLIKGPGDNNGYPMAIPPESDFILPEGWSLREGWNDEPATKTEPPRGPLRPTPKGKLARVLVAIAQMLEAD